MAPTVVNEIQGPADCTHEVSLEAIKTLVDMGVLVHVQTSVYDSHIHRFFVPIQDAHDYRVRDWRSNENVPLMGNTTQIVPAAY